MAVLATSTIFLDFTLPNATSWFYFSWLLAMALFFKFSRLLSVRNWDVISLFLLVPGLLLLQEGHQLLRQHSGLATQRIWFGYLWLLGGSLYFLVRCFLDLGLVRRPALSPNLNLAGLGWLSAALLVCLISVAFRPEAGTSKTVGREASSVNAVREFISQQTPAQEVAGQDRQFWAGRILAISCHLLIVTGLIVVGARHFQDVYAGVAAATFYLLLPYTALQVGQAHLLWLAALLVWAVATYRQPLLAGLLLGLGAGTVYFPALLAPVWFSFYWRRGAGRFAAGFFLAAAASLACTALFLWFQGDLTAKVHEALSQSDWQAWKFPRTESFWSGMDGTGFHWAYRLPVFIA
ncbi:MAG TPA: glycosyltransferase 87 family protein, partial [Gemmataceae bacterium]|nr:glycosyltransferase 87 family protein [Gemmataceae bacterium]